MNPGILGGSISKKLSLPNTPLTWSIGVRRVEFLQEIPHSALGLIWLQGTETRSGHFKKRGFIIQQLLMEFKGGRTAEPQGGFDLDTGKSSGARSFSSLAHFPVSLPVQPRPADWLWASSSPAGLGPQSLPWSLIWQDRAALVTAPPDSQPVSQFRLSREKSSNRSGSWVRCHVFSRRVGFIWYTRGKKGSHWCSSWARDRVFLKEETGLKRSQKLPLISMV